MRACQVLEHAEFELKRFASTDGGVKLPHKAQMKAEDKVRTLGTWLTFLDCRIAELNKVKDATGQGTSAGRHTQFDAESHFERVWNHKSGDEEVEEMEVERTSQPMNVPPRMASTGERKRDLCMVDTEDTETEFITVGVEEVVRVGKR